MTIKAVKYHSLSRRIVAQFCIFTLVISFIYGLFTFLLMYNLEDGFINRDIEQQATFLSNEFKKSGNWPPILDENFKLYHGIDNFPADLKLQVLAEPNRHEFYGEQGRHYHVQKLATTTNTYLVAEVSSILLVRPIRSEVMTVLLYFGVSLALIACLLAWLLGRKTAKPLKDLANLVDGVALQNIPTNFAQLFPKNEIGILANTLEQSLLKISQALEREKCFTRDVSHELRTPVAIIQNAVELYQTTPLQNPQSNSLIKRIADAALQMQQTVTTLLMLAREEHTSAATTVVEMQPLIEQSILDHHHLLENKAVDVQVNNNCDTQIVAQPGMVKVLLDNLISNAFQYTQAGHVSISVSNNTLLIADSGPGIDPTIRSKVTEPAIKGQQSTGYGFGLSIVKRLCEHQAWQLQVSSNQGTEVAVKFN